MDNETKQLEEVSEEISVSSEESIGEEIETKKKSTAPRPINAPCKILINVFINSSY